MILVRSLITLLGVRVEVEWGRAELIRLMNALE
jgi:hypothetical protein